MSEELSRRGFLKMGWAGLGVLVLGETAFIGFKFFAPRVAEGEFGGVFTVGSVEDFPPGSVTPFNEGRFYLVRLMDGGFLAVYRQCTHLGCAVPWDAEKQRFVCPCHGSEFEMDGEVLNAPAPRPLDLFAIYIEGGEINVDTGDKTERDNTDQNSAVYAEVL